MQGPDPKDMEEKVEKMASMLDALQTRCARLLAQQGRQRHMLRSIMSYYEVFTYM